MDASSVVEILLKNAKLDLRESVACQMNALKQLLGRGFRYEDIPSYCQDLKLLNDLLKACLKNHQDIAQSLKQDVMLVMKEVCVPLLQHIYPSVDTRDLVLQILGCVARLCSMCAAFDKEVMVLILGHLKKNLDVFLVEKPTTLDLQSSHVCMDTQTLVETLGQVLTGILKSKNDMTINHDVKSFLWPLFEKLMESLDIVSTDILSISCIPVLLRILQIDDSNLSKYLDVIWESVLKFSTQEGTDSRKKFILLCGFANYFFPVSGTAMASDIRKEVKLWEILQTGLVSNDTVNRKRSIYLLKRVVDICEKVGSNVNTGSDGDCIFWWDPKHSLELSRTWEDFMLLAEVLEEKQVHVIKPLLPRMKNLITASSKTMSPGRPLLHTSWLTTVFLRSSSHESLQIIRWSADTVLTMDLQRCPLLKQGQDKFLYGPFLITLREPKLYIRDPDMPVGTMLPVADKLVQFFTNCWQALPKEKKGVFVYQTIQQVSNNNVGYIPLVFLCRGLAALPPVPCLGKPSLASLRKLLTGFVTNAEVYFRGAIQCFIVQILINLMDRSQVQLEEVMQVLSLVKQEESLQRRTTLWSQCVTWLKNAAEDINTPWSGDNVRLFIQTRVTGYLEATADSRYSTADASLAHVLSRSLVQASDAGIATSQEAGSVSLLVRITQELVTIINSINSHAYMPTHKVDKAILLLTSIVRELVPKNCQSNDEVAVVIKRAVSNAQSEMFLYISRQTSQAIQSLSDVPLLRMYMDSLRTVLIAMDTDSRNQVCQLMDTCTGVLLQTDSQSAHSHAKMRTLSAMCMLGTISHFLSCDQGSGQTGKLQERLFTFLKTWKIVTCFPKPIETSVSHQEWGKITSMYLECQWEIVHTVLKTDSDLWCHMEELAALGVETLAVGLPETAEPVMYSLALLIEKMSKLGKLLDDTVVKVLDAGWVSVTEAQSVGLLEAFVTMSYQPCLLALPEDSPAISCLRKYGESLVDLGLARNGLANILVKQLAVVWGDPTRVGQIDKFLDLLVGLGIFGDLTKRGDRQVFDVCAALTSLGTQCSVNEVQQGKYNEDLLVRATVVEILSHMDPADPKHCCLATSIIKKCISLYLECLGSTNRFSNSLVHRQRNRLMQIILLLESFVTKDYLDEFWEFIWSSLELEGQPSVRHMLEWVAMATMNRHERLGSQLWILFKKHQESRNIVLLSLLTIVVHSGPHLSPDLQEGFYREAFPAVLPWCMAHHFHTRIFAQATLVRLWDQCKALQLTRVLGSHAVLETIVNFNYENRNSTKNVKKVLESFYFQFLDFKRDLSLETIFHTLPAMTGMLEDECITVKMFGQVKIQETGSHRFIPVQNPYNHLEVGATEIWKYKGGLRTGDEGEDNGGEEEGDVQKKIMPWKQMVPDEDTCTEIEHGVKQGGQEGLVVVTSLINKVPNLGGLCRTSEIFGVSEYVLGRLQYMEDKMFQSLSVTAHKWLPVTEVHETRLPEYLQQKRLEGYTLVGVEQTANSVCLTDYTFPVKTLLLLGNEKEGIPVELISLLDVCVEIPQQGVIRSLNVHVSGALLIWEYRRQQLVKAVQP